jgi:hypothetical protein
VRSRTAATTTTDSSSGRFRSVLANRQFLIFLASSNASMVGYAVYAISIVWLAYTVSHDFRIVGAVLFIEFAAYSLTFLTGPVVDRVRNQRTIFLASYPIQAAAVALLGLGARYDFLSPALLFALVAVISLLWDMTWAAINAAPGVLLTRDEQFAASGVTGALGGILNIVGYATGGALILLVGPDGGMFLYAGLLLAATALAVPLRITPPRGPEGSFRESFREGWRVILRQPGHALLQLAGVDSAAAFLVSAPPILITLLAATIYHGSAASYGVLFVADVVGGVVAALVLAQWNPRGRVGVVMAGALILTGGAFALTVALPAVLWLGALAWFAVGFASAGYLDAKYSFFRGSVAPEQIGRLVSNMFLFAGIASSAGALVISAVAVGGAPVPLGLAVGVAFVAAGGIGLALPGVRQMRY